MEESGRTRTDHLWAIVLAGGNGRRVSALTSSPSGSAVPKQYCAFGRETPMLRWALDRASSVVPAERVVAVVAEEHRHLWSVGLQDLAPENILVQPRDRGTAAGILLPVLEILLRRDSEARVLVLPSDHYVADEPTLRRTLLGALDRPARTDDRLIVLGMAPTEFDPEYGWILPSPASGGPIREVAGFVEKPDRQAARDLMGRGALLNAFIFLAQGRALLRLYEETLPALLGPFLRLLQAGAAGPALARLYETLPVADFSREVLERSPHRLSVLPVPDCGWSDLGTPARIRLFLDQHSRPVPAGGRPTLGPRSVPGPTGVRVSVAAEP